MNAVNKPNIWNFLTLPAIIVLSAVIGFAVAYLFNQTFNKEELDAYQKIAIALPLTLIFWKYKSTKILRKISTRSSLSRDEKSRFNIFMNEKIKVYSWINVTAISNAALAFFCIILVEDGFVRLALSFYIAIYTFTSSFMYNLEDKYFAEFDVYLDHRDSTRNERKKILEFLAKNANDNA